MNIQGMSALVTGGGSGLGEATARELARLGAKVAVLDLNLENAQKVAADVGGVAVQCDVTNAAGMENAVAKLPKPHGGARILMQIAALGTAKRIVGKDGNPAPLEDFAKVVNVNLIGTYNAARVFAAACAKLDPMEDGERGAMVFTASVAAFDGQVGQQAYSASKAGVAGMTLPWHGSWHNTAYAFAPLPLASLQRQLLRNIARTQSKPLWLPASPSLHALASQKSLHNWPQRIVSNGHLNGEVIRLDGACAWHHAERTKVFNEQNDCLRSTSDVR